jgi:hypothetical protein
MNGLTAPSQSAWTGPLRYNRWLPAARNRMNYQSRRIGDDGGEVSRFDAGERLLYEADRVGVYGALSLAWLADVARMRSGTGLLQKAYDISGKNNDLSQATVDSRPPDPFFGDPVGYSFGGSGDYWSTPDAAWMDGQWDADWRVAYDDVSSPGRVCAHRTSSETGWTVRLSESGGVYRWVCEIYDGALYREFVSAPLDTPANGDVLRQRLRLQVDSGDVTAYFYKWTAGAWAANGSQTRTMSLPSVNTPLEIGAWNSGADSNLAGRFYRVRFYSSNRDSGGTLVADFSASDFDHLGDTAEDSCGNTWTRNGTGTYMLKKQHEPLYNGAHHLALSISEAANDWALLAAIKPQDTTDKQYVLDAESGRLVFAAVSNTTGRTGWFDGSWKEPASATTAHQLLTWNLKSAGGALYRNGSEIGTLPYTQKPIGGAVKVGSSIAASTSLLKGALGTLLLVSGGLSDAQRAALESTINRIRQVY